MESRIIPLNLPAIAAQEIAGNPASSRLESVVANCWPGLEIDHRNLDRRFFPGLVFEFAINQGAQLVKVDLKDPDIKRNPGLRPQLLAIQLLLQERQLFLSSLQQEVPRGRRIQLWRKTGSRFKWLQDYQVWRLVRSIRPGAIRIELAARTGSKPTVLTKLSGNRREFQTAEGTLSPAYQAGELGQSLCSPWQHDFRDCTCNYWAANHPDIMLPTSPATIVETIAPGAKADNAQRPIMWLRRDLDRQVRPPATAAGCRVFEMDHYQINRAWQDLPFVLERRESGPVYSIGLVEYAPPIAKERLHAELIELAKMEHALALEYLYARYSVEFSGADTPKTQTEEYAEFAAHEMLLIAVSEMMHLRWVNQLMWELSHHGYIDTFRPSLGVAETVPGAPPRSAKPGSFAGTSVERKPKCRPLNAAIRDFLAAEEASGTVNGKYAAIYSLLRTGYPVELRELVSRIIADGVSHYSRFRRLLAILRHHQTGTKQSLLRRDFQLITSPNYKRGPVADVQSLYTSMLHGLYLGFQHGDVEDRKHITAARQKMEEIDALARRLASEGKGLPLLAIARVAAASLP